MKFEGIELTKAFRQVDQEYVDILGRIREGVSLEQTVAELNRRVLVVKEPPVGSVWLSPRNAEVERRNAAELEKLGGPTQVYAGRVEGKFNDKRDRLPAPSELKVRVGAQVMFVKNGGQWINGTLGVVERMQEESIAVRLYETDKVVDVGRAQWDEYEYALNQDTEQIERRVIGSYFQIPLMLAWAVTIHKSQGRTIERVHLDLGAGAFETGQTYVALSRCRSLDGLTLARGLTEADILVDEEARAFYKRLRTAARQGPA
jgi:ATP-dependent exoDNAse (exonuclease V) alpha subunit